MCITRSSIHFCAWRTPAASTKPPNGCISRRLRSSNRSTCWKRAWACSSLCAPTGACSSPPAGQSLYQDARYIIQYCNDSITRARSAMQESEKVIRIGTSPMTPAQFLVDLWPRVQQYRPDLKFQLVPFDNTPQNAREIFIQPRPEHRCGGRHL